MTFRDIWGFLFKWKALLGGLTTAIFLLVIALTYLLDQSYVGATKVVIESNRSPTKNVEFSPSGGLLVELLTTEAEIVQSRAVMVKVVDELRPQDRPRKPPNPFTQVVRGVEATVEATLTEWGLTNAVDSREKWILSLMKKVKAKPVANSGVFRILYDDSEPEWAARIVNSATRHFIGLHLAVYTPRGGSALLKEQLDAGERELDAARNTLRDYKQRKGVTALTENRQELVRSNSTFNEDLVKARSELAELRLRYAPGHEKLQLAEQRAKRLEAVMDSQNREIGRLEREESTVKVYADAIQVADSNVHNLRQRHDDAMRQEAATTDMLNVRVIEYADPPQRPTDPRILLIAISLPIGFALALGLALLFEYFDRRIQEPRMAQALLRLPSLGSVPRLSESKLSWLIGQRRL